jgi:hypothetical protein
METTHCPQIVSAERTKGRVVIEFDDGVCAIYSASLLVAMLPVAEVVDGMWPEDAVQD